MGASARRWVLGRGALILAIFAVWAAPASAATFTAACSGTTGDPASLITAIRQADGATGPSTVALGQGCSYTLTLPQNYWYGPDGLPPITANVTVEGNGSTIARAPFAPPFRLFYVGADPTSPRTDSYFSPGGGTLTLRNVTLSGGLARGGDSNRGGGGAGMGGAIFNQGIVVIDHSTLTGNSAVGGWAADPSAGLGGGGMGEASTGSNGGGFGGNFLGIGNIGGGAGNSGGAGGGAGFRKFEYGNPGSSSGGGSGGGLSNPSGLGGYGGGPGAGAAGDGSGGGAGIGNGNGGGWGYGGFAGTNNYSGGGGGGIGGGGGGAGPSSGYGGGGGFGGGGGAGRQYIGGGGGLGGGGSVGGGPPGFGGGTATTTAGGGGAGMGGAIFNMQGLLTIDDSTLAGNNAVGGQDNVTDHGKGIGGGVLNLNGTFTADNSTFAYNTGAYYASQIYNLGYDAYQIRAAQTTLHNSIVADGIGAVDLASDKSRYITPLPNRGSATVTLDRSDVVRTMSQQEDGVITGTPLTGDPKLGQLRDNGGLTETIALGAGSSAVDAGSGCLSTDQRGIPRPQGSACDIGAYEVAPPAARTGPATDIGTNAATVNATVTANAPDASVHFEWGKSTAYGSQTPIQHVSGFSPLVVSADIAGLQRNTTYHYRVVASSADGTTVGADRILHTAGSTPRSKPILSRLKIAPPAFPAAGTRPVGRRTGTRISYVDSQAAATILTVRKCTRFTGRRRLCVRYAKVGSFVHLDRRGANRFHFNGLVRGRRLMPGVYRLDAKPRIRRQTSKTITARFRVIP